jgi:hypothetical protein
VATITDESDENRGRSGRGTFAITPSDANNFANVARAISCQGSAGNVSLVFADGSVGVFHIDQYEQLDYEIKRVNATGTTATDLRGIV